LSPARRGDNTYSNYSQAQRIFWRQTVLPLVNRTAKAFSAWMSPAWSGPLELRPDLDAIEALSPERDALWGRLKEASYQSHDAWIDDRPIWLGAGPASGCGQAPPRAACSPNRPRAQAYEHRTQEYQRMAQSLPAHAALFAPLDLKSVGDDGAFEGYASLFDREDLGHDVILPGAFAASLAERGAAGIKMLFQHDPKEPIGIWEALFEDRRGLYAKGRLMSEVTRAREVLALMRAGALDGLSIGFKAVTAKREARSGVRRLAQVDLWEISVVTFPMCPEARITSVKTSPFAGRLPTEREFERWLTRDAGLTRSEARAIAARGLKGLVALRDAGRTTSEDAALAETIRRAARAFIS
jgi:hypothetical protein